VGAIVISANDELLRYATLGFPIVTDQLPGLGPLGGLHSALHTVTTPWVFVCPGDMPYMDGQVVTRLREHIGTAAAAYPFDGKREQYLCALIRSDCFSALDEYLTSDRRSVQGFLAVVNATKVDMPDLQDRFANVNDAETLADVRLGEKPGPAA
jgi:molybdopterin-guanine dinucleotide biosynthesis protein A